MLALQGCSAALALLAIAKPHWPAAARIPCSPRQFAVVRFQTLLHIVRASHIQGAIRAFQDVYEIVHDQYEARLFSAGDTQPK